MVSGGDPPDTWPTSLSLPDGATTYLVKMNTINGNGTITSWTAQANTNNSNLKLKIFRLNGSNYDLIATSDGGTFSAGVRKTVSCSITVQTGDYVGVYMSVSAGMTWWKAGDTGFVSHIGDVTTNTPTADWSTIWADGHLSLYCTDGGGFEVYVDINRADDSGDGYSWSGAKKTIYGGINILNVGGLLHIGFGDYSAQTSARLNKTMDILCTTSGGGGAGTVTFPATI